jgi:zinc D-Ala-D-Ala dipeptidase
VRRFDEPWLTRDGAEVVAELAIEVPEHPALPALIEPDPLPLVRHPSDAPLVELAHPRVMVLGNYQAAGWEHSRPDTWLRAETLERLGHAVDSLPDRWGLCVFDAWRPLELQAELHAAAYGHPGLPPGFVSPPDPDPRTPPPHLTGGTVDCSLTIDDIPLGLGAGFDDFTDRARTDALEAEPGPNRDLRRLLFWTMRGAGFVVLDCEWWHFEYGTRRWAAITGNDPLFGPTIPDA